METFNVIIFVNCSANVDFCLFLIFKVRFCVFSFSNFHY